MRKAGLQGRLVRTMQSRSGFTLLEVLIAVVILSLGLLGLSAMTIATIRGQAFSEKMTTATNLAQEKMEEIKSSDYTSITPASYPVEDYNTIVGFHSSGGKSPLVMLLSPTTLKRLL